MVKPKDLKHSNASVEIPCLMSNNVNVFTVIKKTRLEASIPSIYFSSLYSLLISLRVSLITINKVINLQSIVTYCNMYKMNRGY